MNEMDSLAEIFLTHVHESLLDDGVLDEIKELIEKIDDILNIHA